MDYFCNSLKINFPILKLSLAKILTEPIRIIIEGVMIFNVSDLTNGDCLLMVVAESFIGYFITIVSIQSTPNYVDSLKN